MKNCEKHEDEFDDVGNPPANMEESLINITNNLERIAIALETIIQREFGER